ncbi:MAG: PH domain-containing protein [Coriobacteriia bacterium]
MRKLPSERLNKKVVSSWRISAAIWTGILSLLLIGSTVAAFSIWRAEMSPLWILSAVGVSAVFVIVFVVVVPRIRYIRWRYEVTDDEIDIFRGVIVHTRIIVPLVRVQNVNTSQGPILRAFGLASVSVATAAGAHEIPGLSVEEADKLRDRVAILARVAQEDV